MDLSHWIERHARFAPKAAAIRFEGAEISYAELAQRVERAAAVLAHMGVTRGDAVAYLGMNHPAALVLLFACARLGAMFSPLNWRLAPPEHARVLADCPPRVLFAEPAFAAHARAIEGAIPATDLSVLERAPAAEPARVGSENSPLLLSYTSGSTGAPKGVVLTQRALAWNAVNSSHMHDLTSADRILTTLPLFHVGGLNIQTTPALHAGASVTLHAKFEPQAALDAIERERITLTVLVPAQLEAMMALPRWQSADLSSLRMISTGSTIVPEAFVRKVSARGVPVIQVYGSTETCPIAAYVRAGDALRKAGSAGVPALHCELKVVGEDGGELPVGSDGEILVRGPNVAAGYWNAPDESARAFRDGWYHSGDLGHFDSDGHLYVVARKKDMIISGGENIYPSEVESLVGGHPKVKDVAVIGIADEKWGERVHAVIIARDGETPTAEEIMEWCKERIAGYKRPRSISFISEGDMPRTATGKILHRVLRTKYTPTGVSS